MVKNTINKQKKIFIGILQKLKILFISFYCLVLGKKTITFNDGESQLGMLSYKAANTNQKEKTNNEIDKEENTSIRQVSNLFMTSKLQIATVLQPLP